MGLSEAHLCTNGRWNYPDDLELAAALLILVLFIHARNVSR
ncbi:hypothetical protein HMPREF9946_01808 [Acetobacteraceae bacterium AT-5844]|nr:hypothetical protein HMPREF9946_01808 [Acetobacteraceae bacterium AT-5844]